MGGEPSVQSLGHYDLSFHVDGTMYYKFTTTGALGVKAANTMDVGAPTYLLQSTGPSGPPIWKNPADIFDLTEIIQEIDDNYIGKGHLTMFPQKTVVGRHNMSSGLTTKDYPAEVPDNWPNANSFIESGWEINVDETVVRTGGDQVISNKKTLGANGLTGSYGELELNSGSLITMNANTNQYIKDEASVQNEQGGLINLQNKSEFHFHQLDPLPPVP